MSESQRFQFVNKPDAFGVTDVVPQLSFTLINNNNSVEVSGLLDTGASVNVLPYEIGLQLGANWQQQTTSVILAGNLAPIEARGLIVTAQIGEFLPVRLVFAWCQSNDVPLLLGRMNFFREFNACFYTSDRIFELKKN